MATKPDQPYSTVRYWRYVFVPLLLVLLAVAGYTIFTLSNTQLSMADLAPFKSLGIPVPTAPIVSKI